MVELGKGEQTTSTLTDDFYFAKPSSYIPS